MFTIEKYSPNDFEEVLSVFKANIPKYFDEGEENDLILYLNHEVEHYFVVKENERIIGAGRINHFPSEHNARISWDFVHPYFHGKGIGTLLLNHRLKFIKNALHEPKAIVRTSQHAFQFYKKNGFHLEFITKDFWAEGFDLYLMEIAL